MYILMKFMQEDKRDWKYRREWEYRRREWIAYLEEENKNNVNKEKQVDNWKVENE